MSIGSDTLPIEIPYEISGNKIKLSGVEGDQTVIILDDGDLIMNGLRLTKETVSKYPTVVEIPAQTTKSTPNTVPVAVAEPKPVTVTMPTSIQIQLSQQTKWVPSFDCAKASNFAEKAICTDSLLGKLDGKLSENYKNMRASDIGDGVRNTLKGTQKRWLTERNKCTNNQCLAEVYRKRIDEICDYRVISGVNPICTSTDDIK